MRRADQTALWIDDVHRIAGLRMAGIENVRFKYPGMARLGAVGTLLGDADSVQVILL